MLCIQDGTDLNFSGLAQCEGLGSIGTNQTGASSAGLHLHSTFVVTTGSRGQVSRLPGKRET